MIKRLSGPKTHICWTPDNKPENERIVVSLVCEEDLMSLEAKNRKMENAIEFALGCGVMTEGVCKKLEQALEGREG